MEEVYTPEQDLKTFAPLLERMSKDMRNASINLSAKEARFLVDTYYQMQKERCIAANRVRAMNNEPHLLMAWLKKQNEFLEKQIAISLDVYSANHPIGDWMRSICGIGPTISAGILAHIDITRAQTAANLWTFAGLDPNVTWEKGKKRPWNASLKTLCYKAGECFVYVQNKPEDFYGKIYATRKKLEIERNLSGAFKEQAENILKTKNFRNTTEAKKMYEQGMLPKAHIHARARRYAVKIWLSHVHYVWFCHYYGKEPEKPFKGFIKPPGNLPKKVLNIMENGVYTND